MDVKALVTPSCESGATSPSSQTTCKTKWDQMDLRQWTPHDNTRWRWSSLPKRRSQCEEYWEFQITKKGSVWHHSCWDTCGARQHDGRNRSQTTRFWNILVIRSVKHFKRLTASSHKQMGEGKPKLDARDCKPRRALAAYSGAVSRYLCWGKQECPSAADVWGNAWQTQAGIFAVWLPVVEVLDDSSPFEEFSCWEVAMSRFSFWARELRRDVKEFLASASPWIFQATRRANTGLNHVVRVSNHMQNKKQIGRGQRPTRHVLRSGRWSWLWRSWKQCQKKNWKQRGPLRCHAKSPPNGSSWERPCASDWSEMETKRMNSSCSRKYHGDMIHRIAQDSKKKSNKEHQKDS